MDTERYKLFIKWLATITPKIRRRRSSRSYRQVNTPTPEQQRLNRRVIKAATIVQTLAKKYGCPYRTIGFYCCDNRLVNMIKANHGVGQAAATYFKRYIRKDPNG